MAIKRRKTVPEFRWLPLYLAVFIAVFIADFAYNLFLYPFDQERFQKYQRELNFFSTVVEMLTFVFFIYASLRMVTFRKLLKGLTITCLILFLVIYIRSHISNGYITYFSLNTVYIIELATLLSGCIFFFIQLFREPPVENLRGLPGFWVCVGLSFYCLCTLPITIANSYFFSIARGPVYANLYSIIYLFYIILFSLIIRSFLCQPSRMIS